MKTLPMTSGFSFERFKQVLYRTLVLNKKQLILGSVGAMVGLFVFWCLMMIFDSDAVVLEKTVIMLSTGTALYQIVGYIFTASIFNELHKNETASRFLTLPATTAEKLSAAWGVTYLLYTIGAIAILTLALFLSNISGQLFYNSDPLNMATLAQIYLNITLLFYLVFNSVFLLGAVYFRGNNFLKTVFTFFLFLIGFVVLSTIVAYLLGATNFNLYFSNQFNITSDGDFNRFLTTLLYTLPLTALFLAFSYFRLKNRQVV
jgi:hypothetical protein